MRGIYEQMFLLLLIYLQNIHIHCLECHSGILLHNGSKTTFRTVSKGDDNNFACFVKTKLDNVSHDVHFDIIEREKQGNQSEPRCNVDEKGHTMCICRENLCNSLENAETWIRQTYDANLSQGVLDSHSRPKRRYLFWHGYGGYGCHGCCHYGCYGYHNYYNNYGHTRLDFWDAVIVLGIVLIIAIVVGIGLCINSRRRAKFNRENLPKPDENEPAAATPQMYYCTPIQPVYPQCVSSPYQASPYVAQPPKKQQSKSNEAENVNEA